MTDPTTDAGSDLLRAHAEDAVRRRARRARRRRRPAAAPQWKLSPWAVATYLLGGELDDGTVITPKYIG